MATGGTGMRPTPRKQDTDTVASTSERRKTELDDQIIKSTDVPEPEVTNPVNAAGDLDAYSKQDLKQMIIQKDAELISLQNALAVTSSPRRFFQSH